MRKHISTYIWLIITSVMIMTALTGCSFVPSGPDLTAEEEKLISNYAAGVLINHDREADRLATDTEIMEADKRAAEVAANLEALRAAKQEAEKSEGTQEAGDESGDEQVAEKPVYSAADYDVAGYFNLDDISIKYREYKILDSYPEQDDEKYFAMDATAGSKLLVLFFDVTNLSGSETRLSMLNTLPNFRVMINGSENAGVLSTLLIDDLSMYEGTLAPDETVPLVLVCEISETTAGNISSLELILENVGENVTILLNQF